MTETLFPERHDEIMKRVPKHPTVRLWVRTFIFGFIVLLLCALYLYFYRHRHFTLRTANSAFADAGFILIGLSFALSGICYFWNFFDTKIIYRKYLGLVGFFFELAHTIIALFFLPAFPFPEHYVRRENFLGFIAALGSIIIFIGMALISNRYAASKLGGKHWRTLLRTGYVAMILGLIHFGFRRYEGWLTWLKHPSALPPSSIIIFSFGILVLILRLCLAFALWRKKKKLTTVTSTPLKQ